MKGLSLFAAFIVVAFASVAYSFPSGAPPQACNMVSPQPGHGGAPSNALSPYNVSGLPSEYIPGTTYICKSGGSVMHPIHQSEVYSNNLVRRK